MAPVKVLVDLNVVLDVLLARQQFYKPAAAVWTAIESGKIIGLLAAHSISTLFYIYTKQTSAAEATRQIKKLLTIFLVAPIDQIITERALNLNWPDFEDALQLTTAEASSADYLITRDQDGFKTSHSQVAIVSPAEFTTVLENLS